MIGRAFAALLVVLALVAGGYQWGASATTNRIAAESLQAESNKAIALAISNARVGAKEEKSAIGLVSNSTTFQKAIANENAAQKDTVARIRSGAERLSVPTRPTAATCAPGAPAAGAGGRDGETRAELSVEGAEFFTGLLTEADIVVLQLTACQADLELDRETVNQEPVVDELAN